jgi:hypothetical protein
VPGYVVVALGAVGVGTFLFGRASLGPFRARGAGA